MESKIPGWMEDWIRGGGVMDDSKYSWELSREGRRPSRTPLHARGGTCKKLKKNVQNLQKHITTHWVKTADCDEKHNFP